MTMNFEKFLQLTKEYLNDHMGTHSRGDLHIMPRIGTEELLHYLQSLHARFPRSRFSRFVEKLQDKGMIVDSNDKTLTFDPVFPY